MTIAFGLIENANDSLRHAVELMADGNGRYDHGALKHAIRNVAHCVELLLKERLRNIHPAFVWENVGKYPSLEARTVSVDTAIARLRNIGNVALSDEEVNALRSLRTTRNAIEHHEWRTTEKEARLIVGTALSFALDFAQRELGVDMSEQFKDDDTWKSLCNESLEFARAHAARIEKRLEADGKHPQVCDGCGEVTIPIFGGSCELCGHWQEL